MPLHIKNAALVRAAGNKPKIIREFVGRVNSQTEEVSVAQMSSPSGWIEPGQTPEFDEYTIVIRGALRVQSKEETFDVLAGQAVLARRGEWVQYSTPGPEGAEYVAVCVPAFSLDAAHRDE
jgi:mannose-6-phosphate isomerase-like protein (cupin superfamily)